MAERQGRDIPAKELAAKAQPVPAAFQRVSALRP
jgi:hypothetical protein